MSKDNRNQGINMGGGNLTASNIAVGENATINISGDANTTFTQALSDIRDLLQEAELGPDQQADAQQALAALEEQKDAAKPDRSVIQTALATLEKIGKSGIGLVNLGEKLAPHIARILAVIA